MGHGHVGLEKQNYQALLCDVLVHVLGLAYLLERSYQGYSAG